MTRLKVKGIVLLIYVCGLVIPTFAQSGAAFSIKGKISAPVELKEITLSLLRAKDSSTVKVEIPDATGSFTFEKVTAGEYFIRIAHLSVKPYQSPVFKLDKDITLDKITLVEKTNTLNEVTITSTKPFIQQQFDKTVVNVENSIVSAGSTALEVLEKAPGISIDQNENVRMRGKQGVMVMIDGKRVPMSGTDLATMLKGMPASNIERIDLITNPSSKYDAEGNSGIIDIRLKKGKRAGTNGSISSSVTQGKYTKMNSSVNLNRHTSNLNLFGSYNYVSRWEFNDLDIYRTFNRDGAVTGIDDQENYFKFLVKTHTYRAGLDYNISPKTVIGIVGSGFNLGLDRTSTNRSVLLNPSSVPQSSSVTGADTETDRFNPALNLNFKQTLDTSGMEITADLDYAKYNFGDEQNYRSRYYDVNNNEIRSPYLLYGNLDGKLDIKSVKVDYSLPLKNRKAKFEAGLKSSWVKADNDLGFYDRSNNGNVFLEDQSNHFLYKENINAAYVNFSKEGKKWNTQLGLRLENTEAEGNQLSTGDSFDRSYYQLFPSGYIGYKINAKHEVGLSVSRRINRPTYNQLNPFRFYINASTYSAGNPYLNPELSYSFELTHTFNQKFIMKYSYSRTTDNIISVLSPDSEESNVVIQTDRNLAKLDYYGLSISAPVQPVNWWNSVNNITFYYGLYSGNLVSTNLKEGRPTLEFNTNNSITLSKTLTAEINGNYQTRSVYAFLDINPFWSLSAGIQKQLWDKKASLKLNVNDIFFTNKIRAVNTSSLYQEHFFQQRDSRTATLNFTYRFGKSPSSPAPRRSSGAEDEKRRAG